MLKVKSKKKKKIVKKRKQYTVMVNVRCPDRAGAKMAVVIIAWTFEQVDKIAV